MSPLFFYFIFNLLPIFLLILTIALKIYFIFLLLIKQDKLTLSAQQAYLLVIGALLGQSIVEFAWIINLLGYVSPTVQLIGNFAFMLQYVTLTLFLKNLSNQYIVSSFFDKILLLPILFFIYDFIVLGYFNVKITLIANTMDLQFAFEAYVTLMLALQSVIILYKTPKASQPRILNYQLTLFIFFFILPLFCLDFLLAFRYSLLLSSYLIRYLAILSSVFTTLAFTYCLRKVMRLRFFSFEKNFLTIKEEKYVNSFAILLKRLSRSRTNDELTRIVSIFCSNILGISQLNLAFYLHYTNEKQDEEMKKAQYEVFRRFFPFSPVLAEEMRMRKILVYDEQAFSYYYEGTIPQEKSLKFLESLPADIYLPIYYEGQRVACLVVQKNALKNNELYTQAQQDELIMFATYLGSIFNLLRNATTDELLTDRNFFQNQLHRKNMETGFYKESIQSFLYNPSQSKIGIVHYKGSKFTFGTKKTAEIIGPINEEAGTFLRNSLKRLIKKVRKIKSDIASFTKDANGRMIMVHAVPALDEKKIVFVFYYPGLIDILNLRIKLLKNPSEWDYLLYLETTKAGQVAERYYPCSNEFMLNFKINVLKASLGKLPIWLKLHADDLWPTVEMLHKMSLRPTLEVIRLESPSQANKFCARLFGSNTTVNSVPVQKCLLKQLDEDGVIYIHNIHHLSLIDQERFAVFIQQAIFSPNRSKEKYSADVQFIISSEEDLKVFTEEGHFSKALFNELNKVTISLPSLLTLPDKDLLELSEAISTREIKTHKYTRILSLNTSEKGRILKNKPVSWKELETFIKQLIREKITKGPLKKGNDSSDLLREAERLGKNALKSAVLMKMLWKKFDGNQHQLSLLLGVNRSSISRRCKEYGLT